MEGIQSKVRWSVVMDGTGNDNPLPGSAESPPASPFSLPRLFSRGTSDTRLESDVYQVPAYPNPHLAAQARQSYGGPSGETSPPPNAVFVDQGMDLRGRWITFQFADGTLHTYREPPPPSAIFTVPPGSWPPFPPAQQLTYPSLPPSPFDPPRVPAPGVAEYIQQQPRQPQSMEASTNQFAAQAPVQLFQPAPQGLRGFVVRRPTGWFPGFLAAFGQPGVEHMHLRPEHGLTLPPPFSPGWGPWLRPVQAGAYIEY